MMTFEEIKTKFENAKLDVLNVAFRYGSPYATSHTEHQLAMIDLEEACQALAIAKDDYFIVYKKGLDRGL